MSPFLPRWKVAKFLWKFPRLILPSIVEHSLPSICAENYADASATYCQALPSTGQWQKPRGPRLSRISAFPRLIRKRLLISKLSSAFSLRLSHSVPKRLKWAATDFSSLGTAVAACSCPRSPSSTDGTAQPSCSKPAAKRDCRRTHGKKARPLKPSLPKSLAKRVSIANQWRVISRREKLPGSFPPTLKLRWLLASHAIRQYSKRGTELLLQKQNRGRLPVPGSFVYSLCT